MCTTVIVSKRAVSAIETGEQLNRDSTNARDIAILFIVLLGCGILFLFWFRREYHTTFILFPLCVSTQLPL